jgi:hypothetical protein
MVQLVYDAKEIINDSVENYKRQKEQERVLWDKYKNNTPEEIPVEDLVIMFRNIPLEDVPEEVREPVLDYMITQEAERQGPIQEDEVTEAEQRVIDSFALRRGIELDPLTEARKAGIEEGARTGVTGFLARKLGLIDELSLAEEIDRRVQAKRFDMSGQTADYITGIVEGSIVGDPIGAVAVGPLTVKAAATGAKALSAMPKVGSVLGAGAGGAVEGGALASLIPTYSELGDSRLENIRTGMLIGAPLAAVPTAAIEGVSALTQKAPIQKPTLAPQPVSLTPKSLVAEDFTTRPQQIPKPTTVTPAAEFSIDIDTPPSPKPKIIIDETSKEAVASVRRLDDNIALLEEKVKSKGRKKSKPIEKQIETLRARRQERFDKMNQDANIITDQIVSIENQLMRLSTRREALQPSEAGAKARTARAERREQELLQEKNILEEVKKSSTGGYTLTVNNVSYDNPSSILGLKNRIQLNNTTGADIKVSLSKPDPTGNPVDDAVNSMNYMLLSDDVDMDGLRLGLDTPESLSAAGVPPRIQYAQEAAEDVNVLGVEKAVSMSPTEARQQPTVGRGTGRDRFLSQEEQGRISALRRAFEGQKRSQLLKFMGSEDDVKELLDNIPLDASWDSLSTAAEIFKKGVIGKNYDTLLDYVTDVSQNRVLTAIELEALNTLFAAVENRQISTLRQIRNLQKEGLTDSEEMVNLMQDLYLTTYVSELKRTSQTAASHILLQAKKAKKMVESNTRKIKAGKLITNLFGVEC